MSRELTIPRKTQALPINPEKDLLSRVLEFQNTLRTSQVLPSAQEKHAVLTAPCPANIPFCFFVYRLNFQQSTSNIQNRTYALGPPQAPGKQANRR